MEEWFIGHTTDPVIAEVASVTFHLRARFDIVVLPPDAYGFSWVEKKNSDTDTYKFRRPFSPGSYKL